MSEINAMKDAGCAQMFAAPPIFAAPVCPETGTWAYDIHNDMMLWSDALYDLYEVDRAFVPNLKSMLGLVMPGGQSADDALAAAITAGTDFDIEYPVLLRCGVTRWLRTVGRVQSRHGKPNRIVGNTRDVAAAAAELAGFQNAAGSVPQVPAPDLSTLDDMLQRAEVVAAASGTEFAIICFTGIRAVAPGRIALHGSVLIRELIERLAPIVDDAGTVMQLNEDSLLVLAESLKGGPELNRLCGRMKAELGKPISSPFDEIRATFRLDVFRGSGSASECGMPRPVAMAAPRGEGAGRSAGSCLRLIVNNPADVRLPDTVRR